MCFKWYIINDDLKNICAHTHSHAHTDTYTEVRTRSDTHLMRLRVCSWACVCFLPVISSNHKGIENPMNNPRAKCDYAFPESMKSSNTCAACHKNVYLHLGKVVKLYVKCWQKVTHGNYPQKCCSSNSSCNKITVNIGDNPCESCHILESKKKKTEKGKASNNAT